MYWLLFIVAAFVCLVAVPLLDGWEKRRDRADRDFYQDKFGGGPR